VPGTAEAQGNSRAAEVAAFARRFLAMFGARVEVSGRRIEAHLSPELAKLLGAGPRLSLLVDAAEEGAGGGQPGADAEECLTPGDPLLERMLQLAKERGGAAGLMFAPALDPEFVRFALSAPLFEGNGPSSGIDGGLADALAREARKVRFANAEITVRSVRLVHQMQFLFRFKVAFFADEKRESLVTLLVDPVTERVDRPVDLGSAVSFAPFKGAGEDGRLAYTARRLYRKACEHLAERIRVAAGEFEAEANRRAAREMRRIDEYYRSLAEERLEAMRGAFRKLSAAGVREGIARAWTADGAGPGQAGLFDVARELERLYKSELREFHEERELRLEEVREKYRPRAHVSLVQAACVMAPRIEWTVRLSSKRARRELVLLYDVLRRRFLDVECESCGGRVMFPAFLCACEAVVCECCRGLCCDCGGEHCPSCSSVRCHVCLGPVCPTCDPACPLAGLSLPVELPRVCSACRKSACPECTAIASGYL